MYRSIVLVFAVVVVGQCLAQSVDSNVVETEQRSQGSVFSGLKSFFSIYNECAGKEISPCLKLKLVSAMDRAMRSYTGDVKLVDGVKFVRDPTADVPQEPIKTEAELEATLPRSLADKEDSLDSMILEKLMGFFQSHTLQFKFPAIADMQRSLSEESRGNKLGGGGGGGGKKGGMGLLLLPLLMGGTLLPIALGALALLAGKALIVSKLALVLAGIIGLKKLLGGNDHHESTQHVYASHGHGHGGGHYGRSLGDDAQTLAYRSYVAQRAAPSA